MELALRPGSAQECAVRSEGPFQPDHRRAAVVAVKAAAAQWGIDVPAVGVWTQAAAPLVTSGRARWRLEYDPRMKLVSFEVWADGRCVYGSDDVIA